MAAEQTYFLGTHDEELERLGLQHRVWRPTVLECWRRARLSRGAQVLDVGAGPGFATLDLAELVGPEGQVTAIDLSKRFLGVLEARAAERGFQNIRTVEALTSYDDRFADYWAFLAPRLEQAWRLLDDRGTLYLHLDYREAHYAKVALDALFGRDCFLNEIIWAYDYGAKSRRRWPTKHDTILVYVKNPKAYFFDSTEVDREPYMAPGLVTAEKAVRGKLPTDVWWHTIVTTTGREKTGYPTQKPLGILRRIVQASTAEGDWVLDPFAGSGTTAEAARLLGRRVIAIDESEAALAVMQRRLGLDITRA